MNFSFDIDIFVLLIIFLILLCSVSVYYAFKFALILLRLQDTIEDAIDVLEERQKTMEEIGATPVFFDSVEVRSCINEIKKSRYAIVQIANSLILGKRMRIEQNNLENLESEEYTSEQQDNN